MAGPSVQKAKKLIRREKSIRAQHRQPIVEPHHDHKESVESPAAIQLASTS